MEATDKRIRRRKLAAELYASQENEQEHQSLNLASRHSMMGTCSHFRLAVTTRKRMLEIVDMASLRFYPFFRQDYLKAFPKIPAPTDMPLGHSMRSLEIDSSPFTNHFPDILQ